MTAIAGKMKLMAAMLVVISIVSCNSSGGPAPAKEDTMAPIPLPGPKAMSARSEQIKVGGMYVSKGENGKWSVTKVLAVDDFAVHVRFYEDAFAEKPTKLNSANLKIALGHTPLAKEGFLDGMELLQVEPVQESELEGYRIYQEAMRQQ